MFKINIKKKHKQRFEDGADDSAFVDTATVATMAAFLGSRKPATKRRGRKPATKRRGRKPATKRRGRKPGPKRKKKSTVKRGGSKRRKGTRRR